MQNTELKKHEDLDKKHCKSIAHSISDVIRFSLDENFRERCFELFGVSSTKETEKELNKRLMSIIQNGKADNLGIDLRNALSPVAGDKENTAMHTESLNNKGTDQVSSKNDASGSQVATITQNIFKRNWLHISTKNYIEDIKRRKLEIISDEDKKSQKKFMSSQLMPTNVHKDNQNRLQIK